MCNNFSNDLKLRLRLRLDCALHQNMIFFLEGRKESPCLPPFISVSLSSSSSGALCKGLLTPH